MHSSEEVAAFSNMVISHAVSEAAPFLKRETLSDGMTVNMLGLCAYRYIAETTHSVEAAAKALADFERRVAALSIDCSGAIH